MGFQSGSMTPQFYEWSLLRFKQLMLVTMITLGPTTTFADGEIQNAIIKHVDVDLEGHVVWVRPSLDIKGTRPSNGCATDKNIFAFDPSTSEGRAALAVILSAASEGKKVDLYGQGLCKSKGNAEELKAVLIKFDE